MIRYGTCVALFLATALFADPPRPDADAAPDQFVSVPLDQQRLAGELAIRIRANIEGFLQPVNTSELLTDPAATGLYLVAAANSFAYTGDPELKKVMRRVAHQVIARIPEKIDDRAASALIWGLLTYADETGEDEADDAAAKIANARLQSASPVLTGALLLLYHATGDPQYLKTSDRLVQHVTLPTGLDGFLIANGLVNYYRQIADGNVFKQAMEFWRSVNSNNSGSACATAAAFELNLNLLRSTGSLAYANALEGWLFGPLLALQDPQTGRIFNKHVPDDSHEPAESALTCSMAASLALSDIPEGLWGRVRRDVVIFNYSEGRASIRVRHRTSIQIYAEGDYPRGGDIVLHVEPNRDTHFRLRLRVPENAKRFSAESGGTHLNGKPGEFVTVERDWKKGDTVHIAILTQ